MNVRSPITLLMLLGLFTTGIFIACHKEVNQPGEQAPEKKPFTVKEARKHFYKNVRPAMTLRQQKAGKGPGKLYPLWDKAQTFDAGDYQIVEVPAYYEKRQLMAIRTMPVSDTAGRTAPPTKDEMGNFDRLVIYKFNDGSMSEKIVTYMPESGYMARHKYDASQNRLWALDKDFSGYLVHRTLEGKPVMAFKMKSGKIVSRLDYGKAARLKKENAKWVEKCTTESITIGWYSECTIIVIDDPGQGTIIYEHCEEIAIIEIVEVCEDVWEEDTPDCWQTPHAPGCPGSGGGGGDDGGGGGGGDDPEDPSTPPPTANALVGPAADPVSDLGVYLAPLDIYSPAKLILCTRQPVPGSRLAKSGSDMGATFLTFEQMRNGNLVRRSVGFYPVSTVTNLSPSAAGQLGNAQTYYYNVKLEVNISPQQFQEIYDEIYYSATGNYNLRSYNDHYLGYRVGNIAAGIQQTMGSLYPGGPTDTWTAGDLGEDLKAGGGVAMPSSTAPLPNAN